MKKIAMLLSNPYRPDPRVQKEAASLENAGYQVSIICWDRKGELPAIEVTDIATINRIQTGSSFSLGSKQMLHFPRFWFYALRALNRIKPDIVHCHDLDTAIVGYLFSKWYKTPWIYDSHDHYPSQMSQQVHPLISKFLYTFDEFISRRTSKIITVSETMKDYFKSLGRNSTVISNFQIFLSEDHLNNITRESLGLSTDDYIVGYIGGFTPGRAIIPLIESLKHYPPVKILIAGDGPQKDNIISHINNHNNAQYLGWIPLNMVPSYFNLFDVYYYGLYSECPHTRYQSPNSLYTAMMVGKPIITTDIGEISDVVTMENCGIVIKKPTADQISKAIQELSAPSLRAILGENGRNAALEKYNWSVAEAELLGFYVDLFCKSKL